MNNNYKSNNNEQIENQNRQQNNGDYLNQHQNGPESKGRDHWNTDKSSNPLKKAIGNKGNNQPNTNNQQNSNNNRSNNNQGRPTGKNNKGRDLLNGMKKNAKPEEKKATAENKKVERAAKLAKHVPIPQVKAAGKAIEKLQKTKVGKAVGNKLLGGGGLLGGGAEEGATGVVLAAIRRKIIIMLLPAAGFFFILLLIVMLVSSIGGSTTSASESTGNALCTYSIEELKEHGIKKEVYEECDKAEEEAKDYYKRIQDVRDEYKDEDKDFSPVFIEAVRVVVSSRKEEDEMIEYEDMDEDAIREIVEAMFKDDSYDEKEFKKNLKEDILPSYISDKKDSYYDRMVKEIFEFKEEFDKVFEFDQNTGTATSSSTAMDIVKVAQKELDQKKNKSFYGGKKYWQFMGRTSKIAWCASFVSWCANEAGVSKSVIPHRTAVDDFYKYYAIQKHGKFHKIDSGYKPQPGDLIIWKRGQNAMGASHIGIVEKLTKNGELHTIEGNAGGYEPNDRVHRNKWKNIAASKCTGFATPEYGDADTITNGKTINIPSGLGTEGSREFDLADTKSEIAHSRSQMRCCGTITNPYAFPEKTPQRKVQDLWIKKGHKYTNGFCSIDGRILVATTKTFGTAGEKVDFYMSGGKIIKVIIVDTKNETDDGCTKWGHKNGKCILEFTGQTSKIGNNPYHALGVHGQTVKKAVKGGSIFK